MPVENPSTQSVEKLLAVIAPGSKASAVKPLPGSYSNLTHLVEAVGPGGMVRKFVVRRHVQATAPGKPLSNTEHWRI